MERSRGQERGEEGEREKVRGAGVGERRGSEEGRGRKGEGEQEDGRRGKGEKV